MKHSMDLFNRIIPEAALLLKQRYDILSTIHSYQPLGRRSLVVRLSLNERRLRRELDFMRRLGLIEARGEGVYLTEKGLSLLLDMQPYVREALGLTYLEDNLRAWLGLARVVVVPGDSDTDEAVSLDMARAAARLIRENLQEDSILAVTGGWTLARVSQVAGGVFPRVTVVPARGGLGEKVEIQANTIAARLAENLGGNYRLLHVPENLDPAARKALLADARIQEVLRIIREADLLLYGVARADTMAGRRGLSPDQARDLQSRGAVAEALGNYFNEKGEVVASAPGLSLEFSDMPRLNLSIAVAGGGSKALALGAALKNRPRQVLITDEGAARGILESPPVPVLPELFS